MPAPERNDMEASLLGMFRQGLFDTPIHATFPLERYAEAVVTLEDAHEILRTAGYE